MLIGDPVLRRLERAKLVDIGAGSERLVAGAPQHQHLDRAVLVGPITYLGEALIHREGEGVPGLRTVENNPADAVVEREEEVLPRGQFLLHVLRSLFGFYILNAKFGFIKLELHFFE